MCKYSHILRRHTSAARETWIFMNRVNPGPGPFANINVNLHRTDTARQPGNPKARIQRQRIKRRSFSLPYSLSADGYEIGHVILYFLFGLWVSAIMPAKRSFAADAKTRSRSDWSGQIRRLKSTLMLFRTGKFLKASEFFKIEAFIDIFSFLFLHRKYN